MSGRTIAYQFFRTRLCQILGKLMLRRSVWISEEVLKQLWGRNCSLVFLCYREEARCSLLEVDEVVTDLYRIVCTLFVENLWGFVLEETITSLLSDFCTQGVLGLLTFLEEFWNFFKTGIRLLFFLFGILNVVEEESIGFVVDFLSWSLRFVVDVAFKGVNPIDFLSWHSNQYYNSLRIINKINYQMIILCNIWVITLFNRNQSLRDSLAAVRVLGLFFRSRLRKV